MFKFRLRKLWLGLITFGLAVLIGWGQGPDLTAIPAMAMNRPEPSPNQQRLPDGNSLWRRASFPLENFQGYTSAFGPRSNPFGAPTGEFHGGLDMAAPMGSYVRSWWSGRVTEVSDHTGCGTMVRIQSGAWEHAYCHMQGSVIRDAKGLVLVDRPGGILLRQGQAVAAGARIGRVGMTGRTTGPHLCWRLKHNGSRVDPALVLRAMIAARR